MSSEKLSNQEIVRGAFKAGIDRHSIPVMYIDYGVNITHHQVSLAVSELRRRREETYPRATTKSPEHRKNIGKSKLGILNFETANTMTKEWKAVYPLGIRNAAVFEIAELLNIPSELASAHVKAKRRIMQLPDEYKSPENVAKRRKRSHIQAWITKEGREPDPHYVRSLAFAKSLISHGFIASEPSAWKAIEKMFRISDGRDIQDDFVYGLVLESFLVAREMANLGDKSLLLLYFKLGNQVDTKWFTDERLNRDRRLINTSMPIGQGILFPTSNVIDSVVFGDIKID